MAFASASSILGSGDSRVPLKKLTVRQGGFQQYIQWCQNVSTLGNEPVIEIYQAWGLP